MSGVWAEDYEEDDFLNYYGEAEEVPEPGERKTKVIDPDEPKKPRVVQNPRLKLDIDRLMSEDKGLPEFLRMASKITNSPGKEVDHLKKTMAMTELWAHRLFPRYTLDDFLTKCETLGKKRPVKTHLRKVRIGMIPI